VSAEIKCVFSEFKVFTTLNYIRLLNCLTENRILFIVRILLMHFNSYIIFVKCFTRLSFHELNTTRFAYRLQNQWEVCENIELCYKQVNAMCCKDFLSLYDFTRKHLSDFLERPLKFNFYKIFFGSAILHSFQSPYLLVSFHYICCVHTCLYNIWNVSINMNP